VASRPICVLEIHGRYSIEAERPVCLSAAGWAYDVPPDWQEEFCGLQIGETAIRESSISTAISGKPAGMAHKPFHRNPRLHPSLTHRVVIIPFSTEFNIIP
jgi:hypothetical protein